MFFFICAPFALQKDYSCKSNVLHLECKTTTVALQNDHSCIVIVLVLHCNVLFLCTPLLHIFSCSCCNALYISNLCVARSKLANFDPTIVLLAQLAFLSDRKKQILYCKIIVCVHNSFDIHQKSYEKMHF